MNMNDQTSNSNWPIIDTNTQHGIFMLGTTTLYLCHMPGFTMENHHYQLTLQVHLDSESMRIYLADKANYPNEVYNLINLETDQYTVPDLVTGNVKSYAAEIYRGYANAPGNTGEPGPVIVSNATVTVDRVVYFRPFNQNIPRPTNLTYILFGDGQEAHLDHYLATDPDFVHLLTLPSVPTWLSTTQLQSGVSITFAQGSTPFGCTPPLQAGEYPVLFQGIETAQVSVQLGQTYWFSTGNFLNSQDPCQSNSA